MKSFIRRLWQWIYNPIDMRLERYLAGSADLAELEHRQQKWLRMREWERDRWWLV